MPSKKFKKFYRYFFLWGIFFFKFVFNLLPLSWVMAFGRTLGRLAYFLVRRERRRAWRHLSMALYKDKSEKEIYQIALRMFENYGLLFCEWLCMERIAKHMNEYVIFEQKEYFDALLSRGKGMIAVIAHFGNWELMGGCVARDYPLSVLARKVYFAPYDKIMIDMRERLNIQTIYRDSPIRKMMRALHDNRILALVVDQDIDSVDGIFVDFFGREAYTPVAPVRFAQTTGAPLVPVFIVREKGEHRIIACPEIQLDPALDKQAQLRKATQEWVSVQEQFIRQYPDQWIWSHKRWKTRPTTAT